MSLPLDLRPMGPDDLPFVLDGWIRSWRVSPWAGCIPNNRVFELTREAIAGLLLRGATIEVASVSGTQVTRLVGFVCYEPPDLLHYVYVKKTGFRGLGIGRQLVDTARTRLGLHGPGRLTHRTSQSGWLLDGDWQWDPVPARTETVRG